MSRAGKESFLIGMLVVALSVSRTNAVCLATGKICGVGPANDRLCCAGLVCGAGNSCRPGCRINGTLYQPGAVNPRNACQLCQPSSSTNSWTNRPAGTTCNDGNACTQIDKCQSGTCTGTNPIVCGASDQCHDLGECDPRTGLCSDPSKPNGTVCDDGDVCTTSDSCQAGVCLGDDPITTQVFIAPGSSPAGGYLPLSSHGTSPIAGMNDDAFFNFTVPPFLYGGIQYSRLAVSSNGYVVAGGGDATFDERFLNQNLPDPTRPNNVLAPFWTDLNPASGGAVRIDVLTDNSDRWIVVDWEAVREFSTPRVDSFQIWIGILGDANPGEDISYAYGPIQGNGDAGLLTVGAENACGTRGAMQYFNGLGTLPANGTQLRVTTAP